MGLNLVQNESSETSFDQTRAAIRRPARYGNSLQRFTEPGVYETRHFLEGCVEARLKAFLASSVKDRV
jgi:hypothetical protein